jgi:integration host factor subunit beta
MTKAELANMIARQLGQQVSFQQVNFAIQVILDRIIDAVSQGERVEIRGLGAFSKRKWGPRHARNPYTKESWMTEPRAAIHFKPGKLLRDAVNGNIEQASASKRKKEKISSK